MAYVLPALFAALCGVAVVLSDECSKEGLYPTEGGFFACVQTRDRMIKVPAGCPQGTRFSPELSTCVPAQRNTTQVVSVGAGPCLRAGIDCVDCKTLRLCVDDGKGGFLSLKYRTCALDEVCSNEDSYCVKASQKTCSIRDFACKDKGIFPNPTNCSKYYVCLAGSKMINVECPPGQGYNVQLLSCSAIAQCSKVPLCNREFQTGIVGDGSIFYVCTYDVTANTLAPDQYACPTGKRYSPTEFTCK